MDWRRLARTALPRMDDATAAAYLDELMKAERYADQVKYLDQFYGRQSQQAAPTAASAPATTAEQMAAAGIPMPSYARRLVNSADEAASAGLGPENAALRQWIESQTPPPAAIPRGSQQTALEAIGDSWDTQLRRRALAPLDAASRRAELWHAAQQRAAGAASSAAAATAALGRGAANVVSEMGPLPLAATAAGTATAIGVTRAAMQQKQEMQERLAQEQARAKLTQTPDDLFDPVAMDIGFADPALEQAMQSALRESRGTYTGMIPPRQFYDIIQTLDDPAERMRLSFDAFSDSDMVDEFRPRPRVAIGR